MAFCEKMMPRFYELLRQELAAEETAAHAARPVSWFHSTHSLDGHWTGPCATREEAVQEGLREHAGTSFFVTTGVPVAVTRGLPRVQDFISDMQERAADDTGSDDEVLDFVSDEATATDALRVALETWAKKHLRAVWYEVDSSGCERIDPNEAP